MSALNSGVRSSSDLARLALMYGASLALAASVLGVFGILQGAVAGVEAVVLLSSGLFGSGLLVTLLVFRRVKVQTLATVSTTYYGLYLCACMAVTLGGWGNHRNLFTYMVWFFPLLVFNNLVNSPSAARFLARFLIGAPLIILIAFSSRFISIFQEEYWFLAIASCMSYACFGVMLNAVSRYREAYIIEQERAESMRLRSEIMESISDCFISLNSEFKLNYLNDAACSEFSVSRLRALNRTLPIAVPGFFSQVVLAELEAASLRSVSNSFEMHRADCDEWYEMRCFPRLDGMSIYFRNITESVSARASLEAAHNHLSEQANLLDMAQDAIFLQDMESRVLYWNKGAERLFGWSSDEVMGLPVGDIFHQDIAGVEHAYSSVIKLGEWTGELSKRHRDGRLLIVESRCTLLRSGDGSPRVRRAQPNTLAAPPQRESRIIVLHAKRAHHDPIAFGRTGCGLACLVVGVAAESHN